MKTKVVIHKLRFGIIVEQLQYYHIFDILNYREASLCLGPLRFVWISYWIVTPLRKHNFYQYDLRQYIHIIFCNCSHIYYLFLMCRPKSVQ